MKALPLSTLLWAITASSLPAIPQDFGTFRPGTLEERLAGAPDFETAAHDLPWKDLGGGRFRLEKPNLTIFGLAAISVEMVKEDGKITSFEISYHSKKEADGQPTHAKLSNNIHTYTGRSPRRTPDKSEAFDHGDKAIILSAVKAGSLTVSIVSSH